MQNHAGKLTQATRSPVAQDILQARRQARIMKDFKRTIRSVFHRVSNQKLEHGDETHVKILDSVKDIFRGIDEWNRELKVSVFKKKFRSLLKI